MSEMIPIPIDVRWPGAWRKISSYLESARLHGSQEVWNMEDIYNLAVNGQITCWGIVIGETVVGAAATSVRSYPRKKAFEILLLSIDGGMEKDWLEMFEKFKIWAKSAGYQAITGGGRPGWARKLGAKLKYEIEIDL